MPKEIVLPNNWTPRRYQMKAWMAWQRGVRRSILIWHRRAGKDEVALHKAAVAAHERVANYWHCLPAYEQARKAIWEAINPHSGKRRIDEAFPLELRKRTDNQSMTIEFHKGSIWKVVGSDNPNSLVGAPPAGIVFSEWALANPSAWAYLAPILEENKGWADFITTPRGRNHVLKMLEYGRTSDKWFAQVLTVADTGVIPLEQIEEARKEYHAMYGVDAGDALIDQEYWCSFEAAILGAYWGREIGELERKGHVRQVTASEGFPVHCAWDLGVGDAMAIWFFQVSGDEIHVLDYFEAHGYAIGYYANMKKEKAEKNGWTYGYDYVPHDARQRSMTSAGRDGRAKQRLEVMIEERLKPLIVPLHKIEDGISAVRQVLPKCWFDTENCAEGLERLRQYRAEWNDDAKCFVDRPMHDWTSHGADAFRYLAMAYQKVSPPQPAGVVQAIKPLSEMTYDEFWATTTKRRQERV